MVTDTGRCNFRGVAADRETVADQQLHQQLLEVGITARPRQFKRWREAGLLAGPIRRSAGRGKGRPSVGYPPEAVGQASAIIRCLGDGVPLRYVAAIMFYRDVPVPEQAVRASYLAMLTDLEGLLPSEHDLGDAADKLAQHLRQRAKRSAIGRAWIARADTYGARAGSPVEDALSALTAYLFADEQASASGLAALIAVVGAPPDATADVKATLQAASLIQIRDALTGVNLVELQAARTYTRHLHAIAFALSQAARSTAPTLAPGLDDAHLNDEVARAFSVLPNLLILRDRPELQETINGIVQAALQSGASDVE